MDKTTRSLLTQIAETDKEITDAIKQGDLYTLMRAKARMREYESELKHLKRADESRN